MEGARVTAAMLVVGNEILSGRTRDANIQYLGAALGELGIRLVEARVVEDDVDTIVAALDALRERHAYVFTSGGIGPTHDDVTAAAVARAFGRALVRHPEAVRRLEGFYGAEINEARLKMAEVPEGAELIDNPISAAPGFRIGNVHVFAGVPRIMQAMFEGIRHSLKGGPRMLSETVTILIPEGRLAAGLARVQTRNPRVEIGSYPFSHGERKGVRVVARGHGAGDVAAAVAEAKALAAELGGRVEEEG